MKPGPINLLDVELDTAKRLFNYFLEDYDFEPKHVRDVSEKQTSGYVFRGQSSDWPLLPTAHRQNVPFDEYTPQPPSKAFKTICKGKDRYEYVAEQIHAEIRSIMLFLEAADRVGIKTPLEYHQIAEHDVWLNDLRSGNEIPDEREFPTKQFLSSVALAQHYGVPTRLLDWTESPFIAAFMAANSALKEGKTSENDRIYIYCLHDWKLRTITNIRVLTAPRAGNDFLRAQRGMFTLIPNANQYFLKHGNWPSIEDALYAEDDNRIYFKTQFKRVSIPSSESVPLIKLLYRIGISPLTMMPSLQQAAKDFNFKRSIWS